MPKQEDVPVNITSGYGARTHEGFVSWQMGDTKAVQLTTADARRIAGLLLDCAAAAEADAFLMSFMQDSVGVEEGQAAMMMQAFRRWRSRQEGAPK